MENRVPLNPASFSADGRRVALSGFDGSVSIYDLATGQTVATLSTPGTTWTQPALSPDGRRLAVVGRDRNVLLWDVTARRPLLWLPDVPGARSIQQWRGSSGIVNVNLRFSDDGRQIVLWPSSPGPIGFVDVRTWDAGRR